MACENLQSQLAELVEERISLQEELQTAAPGARAALASKIKALNHQIALKKHELEICHGQNPTPAATPLSTVFSGTYTLTINHPSVPGPITDSVSAAVVFNASRTGITMTSLVLPPASFPTPFGVNVTTVSLIGAGSGAFDKPSGNMSLLLPLFFDHSIDIPFYDEDSRLDIPLGTGTAGSLVGSPLDAVNNTIALVGSAVFSGGFLGGSRADLAIMGSFLALP